MSFMHDQNKPRKGVQIGGEFEGELRRIFGRFGNIYKLYINTEKNYANIFFEEPQSVIEACSQLLINNVNNFTVTPGFTKKPQKNPSQNGLHGSNSSIASSNNNLDEMEDMFKYIGDLVDIYGRTVEYLMADNGETFVNLKDVQKAGFRLFKKDYFENIRLSDEEILKDIEAKMIHYGIQCVIEANRNIREEQIRNIFEKVKAKLFREESEPAASFATNNPPPAAAANGFRSGFRKVSIDTNREINVTYQRDRRSTSQSLTGRGRDSSKNRNPSPENLHPTSRDRNQGNRQSCTDHREPTRAKTPIRKSGSSQDDKTDFASNIDKRISSPRVQPSNHFAKVQTPQQEPQKPQISNVSGTENIKPIERVKLGKGSFKLKVTYLGNKSIFYAQLLENVNTIEEILVYVNSEDLYLPVIAKPQKNMLVVVQFEEVWYRGVVVREGGSSGSAIVQLLDYGNKEEIDGNIRQMSEEMQKIPAQAMRFTVTAYSTLEVSKLEIDQEIEVVVSKQFENEETTYLVDIKRILGSDEVGKPLVENQPLEDVKPEPKPAAKCFMQIPKPTVKVVPGEMIFIVNHIEDKLIVKNKEMASLSKKIISHVAAMQKEPVTDPKVGQYVLCNSFDFGDGFFRATIENIHGELASLKLIDFCIEETLPLASLKNIDEDLASLPPAHIEINYPPLKKVTEEGLILLDELIRDKSKIKSTEVNSQIDFMIDGELLSKKITPKLRPPKSDAILSPRQTEPLTVTKIVEPVKVKSEVPESENKKCDKIFFRNMPIREPEAGLNPYFCYTYHGASLTIINASEENVELIEKVTVDQPGDNEPYKPVQFEMCLAKYIDGSWCRAMATGGDDDGKVQVKFVDYGNIANVAEEDIRKLPEEMKSIPILGISAQIEGIELSDAVEKRMKEVIPDAEVLKVDVKVRKKVPNSMNYSVELPAIYDLLKNEGLII